jgi:GNAT superfamily N-acetyltransferase
VSIRLRPVAEGDVEAAAALHLRTALSAYASIFPDEAPKPSHADMAQTWKEIVTAGRGWMAVEGEAPLGVVGLVPDDDGHEMRAVYVDPAHAGRGVGRMLVDRVETVALAENALPLRLWVLEANTSARRWYERRGWVLERERRTIWADIDDVRYLWEGAGSWRP